MIPTLRMNDVEANALRSQFKSYIANSYSFDQLSGQQTNIQLRNIEKEFDKMVKFLD